MRGRMRTAATCVVILLLLEGLLVATGEALSVEVLVADPPSTSQLQEAQKGWVQDSKESLEDNTDDDPDYVPDYDEYYDYYDEDDSNSQEDDSDNSDENDNGIQKDGGPPLPELTPDSLFKKDKRNVKRSYQESGQVVKVPSGQWGSIQDASKGYTGVSTGVEPVFPVGGIPPQEVGDGVVPELEGTARDTDKESSGSSIGGWFREGWRRFSGAVEDLGDKAEDTFSSLGKEVANTAGRVHETISSAVDKLHEKYHELRKKLPEIVRRFKELILKFGVVIQEGARYCLRRFQHSVDQVGESQVIQKLEQKLQEGHTEVVTFFQILGEKVQAWRQQHGSADVDAGLLDGNTAGSGQTQQEGVVQREDFGEMPDFFQDQQVIVQLDKLKDEGVLTASDVIILTQEHSTLNHQIQPQEESQSQPQQQGQQSSYNQQQSQNTGSLIQFPE